MQGDKFVFVVPLTQEDIIQSALVKCTTTTMLSSESLVGGTSPQFGVHGIGDSDSIPTAD